MERVAEIQWGLMITVFALSHVPALLLKIPGYETRNLLLIVFLLIVVQSSDVLQYVWGTLAGKHRIAPALSPSKTVEGFVGGVASATGLGMLLRWITLKDWGWMIEGHGGVLDRLDSVIVAAPVFFHLTRYFWSM